MATLNLYRIRVNATLDGIEEVPGTRLNDVDIIQVSPPEESVEIEAGKFELGNMTVTVRGVAEDYFREANDQDQPFIAELLDDRSITAANPTGLVFWGVVPQAHYNRGTEYTEFTALTAESMLKAATSLPARSVYEVDTSKVNYNQDAETATLFVEAGTPVAIGDVVGMKLVNGELRAPVLSVLNAIPPFLPTTRIVVPVENRSVTVLDVALESYTQGNQQSFFRVDAAYVPAIRDAFPPEGENGDGGITDVSDEDWSLSVYDASDERLVTVQLLRIQYLDASGDALLFITPQYPTLFADAVRGEVKKIESEDVKRQTIKIYGRAAWGYAPTLDSNVRDDYYDIETLIDALLHVGYGNDGTGITDGVNPDEGRPLGIFPWILRNVTVRDGLDLGSLDIRATFNANPLAALRELQMAADSLIRFQPVLDAGLPRIDAEILPRTNVSGDQTATPAAGVIEWTEAETPRKIDAVVVRANDTYMQPEGDLDVVGFWYVTPDGRVPQHTQDGDTRGVLSTKERLSRGVPSGGNVLEIVVPIIPAYSGEYYGGGLVLNDAMLVRVAEYYYDWFNTVGREVNGSLFARDPDLLGKIVSVGTPVSPEGEGRHAFHTSMFVTKVSPQLNETRTDFSGYILPVFVPPAATSPTAVISGARVYVDVNDDGSEEVYLTASSSYNPNGNSLNASWEIDSGSGFVAMGPGLVLQATLALGQHTVRLTVTDPVTGLSDTTTAVVTVADEPTLPTEDEDPTDPRGYNSEQYELGSTGFVRVYPNNPTAVSRVLWRKSTGAELEEIEWDAIPGTTDVPDYWYPEGPLTEANYATNANGQYLLFSVALDELHLSWIEAWIEWDDAALAPTVARFNLDSDRVADFTNASLAIDSSGNVFLNARGDGDTQPTGGVVVSKVVKLSGDPPPVDGEYVAQGSYNNPTFNQNVHSGLTSGQQLYVRVQLLNRDDGLVGSTTYLSVTNTTTETSGDIDYLVLSDRERGSISPVNGMVIYDFDGPTEGLNTYRNANWYRVWDDGNDGAGSGLDADLWDGNQFAAFLNQGVRTTDYPTFSQVALSGDTTSVIYAVRGGRTLFTNNGLTGGGNLTANRTFGLTGQALAIHNFASNGILVRTGSAAFAARTITGTTNQVNVSNGNGVSGNPVLSTPQDIHTAANPQFANLTLTGNATITGFVDADGYADFGGTGAFGGKVTGKASAEWWNSGTRTNAFTILRAADQNEGLRIWVDDTDVTFESGQDEPAGYGGFKFVHRDGTATTREVLAIDGDEFEVHVAAGGGGRLGINTNNPLGELDVDGLFYFRGDQLPHLNYSSSIGSVDKQLLSLHVAELWVQTLVAQETRSTVGGSLLVTQSTELIADLTAAATTIQVKHNNLNAGDVVQLQKYNPGGTPLTQIEFIEIQNSASTVTGGYQYSVIRNHDGTGANNWLAGDSVVSTGNGQLGLGDATGGFIHLFSNTSFFDPAVQLAGPTITFMQRTGRAHDAVQAFAAVGRLEGYYGVTDSETYGFGAGDVDQAYVRVLPGEIAMYESGDQVFRVDSAGLFVDGYGVFSGTIFAEAGEIGGFNINATNIVDDAATVEMSSVNKRFRVAPGSVTSAAAFVEMFNTSGSVWGLRGRVSGLDVFQLGSTNQIAGWAFTNSKLTGGSVELNSSGLIRHTSDRYRLEADGSGSLASGNITWDTAGNASFNGTITAADGSIGGWTIEPDRLHSFYDVGTVYYTGIQTGADGTTKAFFARATANIGTSATFYVQNDGFLFASNANIAGTITASEGAIAGWEIQPTYIRKTSGTQRMTLNSVTRALLGEQQVGATWYTTFKVSAQDSFDAYDSTIQTLTGGVGQVEYGSSTYTASSYTTMSSTYSFNATYGYKVFVEVTEGLDANFDFARLGVQLEGYNTLSMSWEPIGATQVYRIENGQGATRYYVAEPESLAGINRLRVLITNRGETVFNGGIYYYGTIDANIEVEETVDKTQITARGLVLSATADSYVEISRDKFEVAGRNLRITNGGLVLNNASLTSAGALNISALDGLNIVGATNVDGAFSATTKNFRIPHPDPRKFGRFELWHSTVESPTAGENLYTYRVVVDAGGVGSVPLEDYWHHLNENPRAWVQAIGHDGRAHAAVDGENVVVSGESGAYDVLLIGTRKDPVAVSAWKGAERRASY